MGTYMAIGIVTKIGVSKKEMNTMEYNIDKIKDEINKKLYFNCDLYNLKENDDGYFFILKDNILENELRPFLKEIYPHIYHNKSDYYDDILINLDGLNANEIITLAKENSEEAFQYDEYGENDYLYGNFGRCTKILYETVMISMEGKISAESFGKHSNFFKDAITKAYPKYSIANSLRIYITG
jgi:hypothetical protein